jgi:hypothetical protein
MKLANIHYNGQFYKGFVLIENYGQLIEFRHEKTYGLMKDSAVSLVDRAVSRRNKKVVHHTTNIITDAVEIVNEPIGKGIIYAQAELMSSYMQNQEKALLKGSLLVINPDNMVSYFTIDDDNSTIEILEKVVYNTDDIKISKFLYGSHYYAKISSIQVIIDGKQQWNTVEMAQQKAEEFLADLNYENKEESWI